MQNPLRRRMMVALAALFCLSLVLAAPTAAMSDADRMKELQEKMRKIDEEKAKLAQKGKQEEEKSQPVGKNLDEIIARWEALLKGCSNTGKKSARCADALYELGKDYYESARVDYIQKREAYEKAMTAWEKKRISKEPVNPIPDYSKAIKSYEDLIAQFPQFPKAVEAYYQLGFLYQQLGDVDRCKEAFTKVVDSFPQNPRASLAHFRLADLANLDHDNSEALKHLEKVKQDEVDLATWEMTHFRLGEINYNLGEFAKAVDYFQTYVERCDAGVYKKAEFRTISIDYLGICFSEMKNGSDECIAYFEKVGHKPYEDTVMYTVGMKNHAHGQWEDAIKSLSAALNHFPFYRDAPFACERLIECYIIKKQYEKANTEREKLVDNYGENSEWYAKNVNFPAAREHALNEIRSTIASIAIFYHSLAQQKKDKSAYEKALKRYQDFFREFPNDKWRNYEFRFNIADIYVALGDCEHAAENYDYVASQDVSKFPPYTAQLDTFGMNAEQIEKLKSKSDKGPVLISQEDAGYNVIVELDKCRKKAMASQNLKDEQAYTLPQTQKLFDYVEKFQKRFPKSQNAPDVLYLAGSIYYNAKSYDNAVRLFKLINDNYATSKINEQSMGMLANCYANLGQYELAMIIYKQLMAKQKPGSPEQAAVIDLAAAAMFKKAEALRKNGDTLGAAKAFKGIAIDYPASKVADGAWNEAGICYETLKSYEMAAEIFEALPAKFGQSTLREKSFMRAADNYKHANMLQKAAQIYVAAAKAINKPEFAIPCLSAASNCYDSLGQYEMAGKMWELVFETYKTDPKTPQALYNAGLMFEKGKLYSNAITAYQALAKNFPESEYAAESFFAVGLCYEKLGNFAEMAATFSEYAQKYTTDRYKQVHALVKSGNAFYNLNNFPEAEKNYQNAVMVYEKFHKSNDIDIVDIAEAYCKIGDISYTKFSQLQLDAKSENEMKEKVKEKTNALQEPATNYGEAIKLGVEEWTIRATYMIGQGFVDMAAAIANQSLFGTPSEQIASKVKILSSLEKYYDKAQEYFYKNIDWAHSQNISGEYIDKSIDRFMEMLYRKGDIMEEVGRILKSAPVPPNFSKEEKEAYQQVLEEKWLEALDAALPHYEKVVKAAKEFGIAQSQWLDKARGRIKEIKPDDEVLSVTIEQWKPGPRQPAPEKKSGGNAPAVQKNVEINISVEPAKSQDKVIEPVPFSAAGDKETSREMRRIQGINKLDIPPEDKITQLKRVEEEAKKNLEFEQEKIKELKQQLQ